MSQVGFEPAISAGERPQTYALDCTATGTGHLSFVGHETKGSASRLGRYARKFPIDRVSLR